LLLLIGGEKRGEKKKKGGRGKGLSFHPPRKKKREKEKEKGGEGNRPTTLRLHLLSREMTERGRREKKTKGTPRISATCLPFPLETRTGGMEGGKKENGRKLTTQLSLFPQGLRRGG